METKMLNFICFEEEEQSAVRVIQDYFNSNKQLVSPKTIDLLYKSNSPYIVCKFVRIYEPLNATKNWLTLICQEAKSNDENGEGLSFRTYFHNSNALLINDAIQSRNILVGDLFVIHVFKVVITTSLPINFKDFNVRLNVKVNESDVYVWKLNRFVQQEDCTEKLNYEYKHISVFCLRDPTNKNCEIQNLLLLVEGKGNVVPMREVPKKSVNNPIVITELVKIVSELSIYSSGAEIQVKFKEVFFKTKISYGQTFVAFFFGEFAEELQRALEKKDIAVGDLVAICDPMIDKYTAAPVRIHFPPEGGKHMIVLQCRQKNTGKSFFLPKTVDVPQFRYLNKNSETGSKLLKNAVALQCRQPGKVNVFVSASTQESLDGYVLFAKVENTKEQLILDVWNLKNDKNVVHNEEIDSVSNTFIVSQLKKPLTTLKTIPGEKSIVLLLREILKDCQYGASFIVNLYNEVAESFFYSLENGLVLENDLIVIENFLMYNNPQYSKEPIENETFFVDVGSSKRLRTRIVVLKLPSSPIQNSVNIFKVPELKSCTQGTKMATSEMKRTNECFASPSEVSKKQCLDQSLEKHHNCDRLSVNQVYKLPENANPTVSERGNKCRKDEHNTLSSKRFANECSLGSQNEDIEEQQDFLIYPMSIKKPCLKENFMNLVQGQCSLSCGNVVTFPSIICSAFKEPLCPKCLTRLKLFFSFEMEGFVIKTRQFLNIVLEGAKAEKFLGVNCNMFFISEETQKQAKINIQDRVGKRLKVCNLTMKDVSSFTLIK